MKPYVSQIEFKEVLGIMGLTDFSSEEIETIIEQICVKNTEGSVNYMHFLSIGNEEYEEFIDPDEMDGRSMLASRVKT